MVKLFVRFRPFEWLLYRKWNSLHRWRNPTEYEGSIYRMVDVGMITVGYCQKQAIGGE